MPVVLVVAVLNIILIVHAARTGRFVPWGFIILLMPGIGALAYVAVELIPTWFGSHHVLQARQTAGRTLDPDRRYRALKEQLEIADTIATARRLPTSVWRADGIATPKRITTRF